MRQYKEMGFFLWGILMQMEMGFRGFGIGLVGLVGLGNGVKVLRCPLFFYKKNTLVYLIVFFLFFMFFMFCYFLFFKCCFLVFSVGYLCWLFLLFFVFQVLYFLLFLLF
ncbi:hypothetical protein BZA77DRAFT_323512 [Pyronema omphalodes]|nr:hypothetical protein BZA77DRAFT_323512 [Pyronema omphalodes]